MIVDRSVSPARWRGVLLTCTVLAAPLAAEDDRPATVGLVGWFDSQESATLFTDVEGTQPSVAAGDGIALWKSRVGAAALKQAEPAERPIRVADSPGDQWALELPKNSAWMGTSDLTSVVAAEDWTIFLVLSLDSSSTGGENLLQVRSGRHMRGFMVKHRCRRCVHFDWNDDEEIHTPHELDGGWNLVDATSVARVVKVWTNGNFEGTNSEFTTIGSSELTDGVLVLGARTEKKFPDPFPTMFGFIGEILIYDCPLEDEELMATREYLMKKWKIEAR